MITKEYRGKIDVRDMGESMDLLFLNPEGEPVYLDDPLAEKIEEDIEDNGRYLSVSYYVTDEPHDKEEVQDAWVRAVLGDSDVEFRVHWSDITGYLWTDEEIKVGGHDLLAELKSHAGKWLYLTIGYSTDPKDVA